MLRNRYLDMPSQRPRRRFDLVESGRVLEIEQPIHLRHMPAQAGTWQQKNSSQPASAKRFNTTLVMLVTLKNITSFRISAGREKTCW